jgi:predicted transcriptional regulator
MKMRSIKEAAHRLVDSLSEDATWDDLRYQIYVRQNIEAGLADSEVGRVGDVAEVREEFGLDQ